MFVRVVVLTMMWSISSALALVPPRAVPVVSRTPRELCRRLLASSSSAAVSVENNISRLSTLQTLLTKHGAPGSKGCMEPNDLEPVITTRETPELVSSLSGASEEFSNMHPYLFPIAKSSSSPGNYVCAYRNPSTEESDKNHPWPIVETDLSSSGKIGGGGMRLLAISSEHLMRRIACECDDADNSESEEEDDVVALYNDGLGKGVLRDSALDTPYERGSVAKLGYGCDKFVLLRVGPFPDLYRRMALQHADKDDEQSSLIAAEACNGKLPGFASTFRFYARLLSTFPNRSEESRDAARMCLRLPLPTVGLSGDDMKEVAVLCQVADENDTTDVAITKLADLYRIMRETEREEDPQQGGMTDEQVAIDEANHLLNMAALTGQSWSSVRGEVADKFRSVGRDEMANFIDISYCS